ncbi:DMT family transporter [Cerasicoccus fimbriatus]|uniref:DMT family transporter n=1 Tax=Cerasicoccus fimbriatus TaxID=3014554 RepID=UPI0022B51BBF|nr:multidrug efflux SMR transporter [Cerasicoccus sp. TK19100]
MGQAWLFLFLAGLCEIGWPIGLKISQTTNKVALGIIIAIVSMAISGYFLWMAQKQIPIGTAYAVWTGIGAAGTFVVGVLVFGDASSVLRWLGVALIIGGVVTLKLAGNH